MPREYTVAELELLARAVYGERPDWFVHNQEVALAVAQTFVNRVSSPWWPEEFDLVAPVFHGTYAVDESLIPMWVYRVCRDVLMGRAQEDFSSGAFHIRSLADLTKAAQRHLIKYAVFRYYDITRDVGLYGFTQDPAQLEKLHE